ncbi:MAG: hypothetical protein ABIG08_02345 [bacterium]
MRTKTPEERKGTKSEANGVIFDPELLKAVLGIAQLEQLSEQGFRFVLDVHSLPGCRLFVTMIIIKPESLNLHLLLMPEDEPGPNPNNGVITTSQSPVTLTLHNITEVNYLRKKSTVSFRAHPLSGGLLVGEVSINRKGGFWVNS